MRSTTSSHDVHVLATAIENNKFANVEFKQPVDDFYLQQHYPYFSAFVQVFFFYMARFSFASWNTERQNGRSSSSSFFPE